MTLLDQEEKVKEPKGKKIVLFLIIISVILLIAIIAVMFVLSTKQTKPLSLNINGSDVTIEGDMITTDENGITYISLQKISKQIGYDYLTGEYKQYSEDAENSKCYLQDENQVIQFEADTNKIYKTPVNSDLDYEEYTIKNKIMKLNNLLYISLDDVNIGLGIVYSYSQPNNKIIFNTVQNLTEGYKTSLPTQTNNEFTEISEEYENERALAYNMLVVANENKKWGVIDNNFSTIIGNKYTSLEFVESADVFIASDENKFGVISSKPNQRPIIDLNYEEVKVISNSPLFYQVKLAGKYGVINGEGKPVINNEYDSMGYTSKSTTEISVLTIENFGKEKQNLLVVCKSGKYGLVNLETGKSVVDCNLDKIYGKSENGEKNYYIELEKQEVELGRYIEFINTSTINVGNN